MCGLFQTNILHLLEYPPVINGGTHLFASFTLVSHELSNANIRRILISLPLSCEIRLNAKPANHSPLAVGIRVIDPRHAFLRPATYSIGYFEYRLRVMNHNARRPQRTRYQAPILVGG